MATGVRASRCRWKVSTLEGHNIVRVSLWFLYISVGGMLVLFMLLKNAGQLKIIIKDEKSK